MSNMVFLSPNEIQTQTSVVVASGTLTAENLLDGKTEPVYATVGYADDSVSAIISVMFPSPVLLDTIAMQNHNLKQFRFFYNSLTANVFTPDLNVSGNAAKNNYFEFGSVQVNSFQLQMDKTILADQEKEVGELIASKLLLRFDRNPANTGYTPIEYRKQVRHEMPDGGVVLFTIADKFRANFRFQFMTQKFRDDLRNVWKAGAALYFVPFPDGTDWDGAAHSVVWPGDFDFKYSANPSDAGFSGSFTIEGTP